MKKMSQFVMNTITGGMITIGIVLSLIVVLTISILTILLKKINKIHEFKFMSIIIAILQKPILRFIIQNDIPPIHSNHYYS